MGSLGFVYGLLLGNCGYQTDRKIYDQSKIHSSLAILSWSMHCVRDKIVNSFARGLWEQFELRFGHG